jgi:predicted enzyme related to lactoylglutathione lyase
MSTTSATPPVAAMQQRFEKIMPEFPLADVAAGVAHYRDVLGFSVNYEMDGFAVMDRDRARLLLIAKGGQHRGIASCYVYVADADALHAELTARGARVEAAPVSRPWGLREFRVFDPEGNILTFGQPFEA